MEWSEKTAQNRVRWKAAVERNKLEKQIKKAENV